jgi:hypothetical protein
MYEIERLFDLIYPISILSVWLLFPTNIYAWKIKNKNPVVILTLGYILLDTIEYFVSPILIKSFKNNYPLLNINLLLDSTLTLLIFYLSIKTNNRVKYSISGAIFLVILLFILNICIVNNSIFNPLEIFRFNVNIILSVISFVSITHIFLNVKSFKHNKHFVIFCLAIIIYNLPNLVLNISLNWFTNNNFSSDIINKVHFILACLNLLRNLLITYYVFKISKNRL